MAADLAGLGLALAAVASLSKYLSVTSRGQEEKP